MSRERPILEALASRLGILAGYVDVTGRERATPSPTREALVGAMGFEASDESSAQASLDALDRAAASRLLEPVCVWREWRDQIPLVQAHGEALGASRSFELVLTLEDGTLHRCEGDVPDLDGAPTWSLPLPLRPPHGYHEVALTLDGRAPAVQQLVMAPRGAFQPEEAVGEGPAFGLWTNLYTVRSETNWGHGTLTDLAELARFAGRQGASFVGLNPLHAVPNRGLAFSPYSPSSRLYRNLLYLDPEQVPELEAWGPARALLQDPALRRRRELLREADQIDHGAVMDSLLPVFRALHQGFRRLHEAHGTERDVAYRAYLEREGETLIDFATWEVLAEHHGSEAMPQCDWWRWPLPHRDPRSAAVEAFRSRHAEEVALRCWLQFELDRQLADAARCAQDAGCGLGFYQDLAVGASRASAEGWLARPLLAQGVNVGAPPDDYAPEGQDWGIPPLDPHRLRTDGYRFFRRLLRAGFAHAGALRLDHAMQLMRLFWIPEGRPGSDGAYVSYRADELLGVLALESRRHSAAVVAEDLGTVPPELPGLLEDWGLLRSAVAYFSRDAHGAFRPPDHYVARGLATVGTHDLTPLKGFWLETDISLRASLGLLDSESLRAQASALRAEEREALLDRLRAEGLVEPDEKPGPEVVLRAVHALLDRTPSVLVAASLDDLAGETEPVNVPGVPLERHRSWSRRMRRPLEELVQAPDVLRALEPFQRRAHPRDVLG